MSESYNTIFERLFWAFTQKSRVVKLYHQCQCYSCRVDLTENKMNQVLCKSVLLTGQSTVRSLSPTACFSEDIIIWSDSKTNQE